MARRALVPPRPARRNNRPITHRGGVHRRNLGHRPHRRRRIRRTDLPPHALQRETERRHGRRVRHGAHGAHRADTVQRAVQAAQLVAGQRGNDRERQIVTSRRLDRVSTPRIARRDGPQQRAETRVRPGLGPTRGLPGMDEVAAVRVHAALERARAGD